ncbi:methyl-accepting chemotaxis protein [Bacillus cabrialesii]|uniref:Methyl-accepting chemotaxis protein n=1 Tax=Bacillus cabrialesii subsp. tritici TaxID=2944916 RepID=A0ABT9DP56_9BACI|nr:methyl-accepting chemotaxis protein [Bacillus cabrialesii]MBU2661171.1 HAMP domain-containing protein [Bacillus cabrialesii]MDO8226453.1 methyl-accepting chemotaxis protein [Bacillus cabrialesii subsp. tritici]
MGKFIQWIKQPSISKPLIAAFLAVLILPVGVLAYFSYQSAWNALDRELTNSAMGNVEELNSTLQNKLNNKVKALDYYSETLDKNILQAKNKTLLNEKLKQYTTLNADVGAIYAASENKKLYKYPNSGIPKGFDPTERDWYKQAVAKKGQAVFSEPYTDEATGDMVVTISEQLKDGSGVVAIDLNLDEVLAASQRIKIGKEGFAFITTGSKKYIAHPTIKPGTVGSGDWTNEVYSKEKGSFEYTFEGKDKKMAFTTNKLTGWKIGGTYFVSELQDASSPVLNTALIILCVSIVIGGILILLIIRAITKPLRTLVTTSAKISSGDLTEVIDIHSKNELGQLGESFNEMSASLRSVIGVIQTSVENVASSSEELTASAAQTSKATEHITLAIEQFSDGNEAQSEKLETSSNHLSQMNDGISKVAQASSTITKSSIQSSEAAGSGEKLVEHTVGQMKTIDQSVQKAEAVVKGLETKSQDITSILNVINGIADQTNLLALNAAIEAARAGEFGRGFSVVAEEVRKLAVQSADSAKEIEGLIQEIVREISTSLSMFQSVNHEVKEGLQITDKTADSFKQIYEMTTQISGELQSLNATVEQLSAGSQEVSSAVEDISAVSKESSAGIQDIAASAEEQLASMEEISSSAETLANMAEELQDITKKFKIES